MTVIDPLQPDSLFRYCDVEQFEFDTTDELADLHEVIGQPRVLEAIRLGVGMQADGYNLYVLGSSGSGRLTIVQRLLGDRAKRRAPASDWCYCNNFSDPQKPRALKLPAGDGSRLEDDLEHLLEDLGSSIPAAFASEEYRSRKQEIEDELDSRQEEALSALKKEAEGQEISLLRTPGGFAFAPMRDHEVLSPEQFQALPKKEQNHIEKVVGELQAKLQKFLLQVPLWRKEMREKTRELNRDTTLAAVGHSMEHLREVYREFPNVLEYLDTLQQDVIDNGENFLRPEGGGVDSDGDGDGKATREKLKRRYQLNLIVENEKDAPAPVVYEDNPSFQNLVGRVEHVAQMGTLLTDFTLIHAGALHRANGGYLILDIERVLRNPFSWEGLKRTLFSKQLRIESVAQFFSLATSVSLEPEPIPLDVKIILIGDRLFYYLLCEYDPDFSKLFKVAADFEERIDWVPENAATYARLIATVAREKKLRPLDRGAVGRVIEEGARLVGDSQKLSMHMGSIVELLQESDFCAGEAGRRHIARADVQDAIDAKIRRLDRMRDRIYEEIERGTIMIDTDGEMVGRVNGLSVLGLGSFSFGQPSRISATVRFGEGEVIDIEREVEMGGSIHSKGVLILSSFLASRFGQDRPLSVSASLVFEQSYGMVEGDSASVGEVCALLSALAGVPVKQSLAVTGSVNQHGETQAIGSVNEKIEGFFAICSARGLTGKQGVLIPAANVKHLMLKQEVVDACRSGRFHVYGIETIDQAVELLTGIEAGRRDKVNQYPPGTINRRVDDRLAEFAKLRQALMERGNGSGRKQG